VPLSTTVKSLVLATDVVDDAGNIQGSQVWLLLLRGDHDMNEIKVGKVPGLDAGFRFATVPEIEAHFGTRPGYLGPIGLKQPVKVVADREVALMADWICGANEEGFHVTGVNWGRDLPEPDAVADLRNVVEGDASPDGKGRLAIERGGRLCWVQPGALRDVQQDVAVADVAAWLEVGVEQRFGQTGLRLGPLIGERPAQQLVRLEGVPHHRGGLFAFAGPGHRETGALRGGLHLRAHRGDFLGRTTVNPGEMLVLPLAFGREVGIELERHPANLDV
jgi:hypothetical protein